MVKTAILQVADTSPLESLVAMLQSAGYHCFLPNSALRDELRRLGCDTVVEIKQLVDSWGYEEPRFKVGGVEVPLPQALPLAMESCDLFVDVKAHRNGPKVWKRWPRLQGKTLWYRINGGQPEHVVNARGDHGDEVNPPCPILTPNQWYKHCLACTNHGTDDGLRRCPKCKGKGVDPRQYCCWPPFVRFEDYWDKHGRGPLEGKGWAPPFCLVHNLKGWGYGDLINSMRGLSIRMHGVGSPDGLVPHKDVPRLLSETLAYVHLKSNDAPGYALYEALAAGCPVICTRKLIWKCRMQELLIPNETCLVFDRETHDGFTPQDIADCTEEVRGHLERLRDPAFNLVLGMRGRARLQEVMWRAERDGERFREFMRRNFGG